MFYNFNRILDEYNKLDVLCYASQKGLIDITRLLLMIPEIDVNKATLYAAENGHLNIIKTLEKSTTSDVNFSYNNNTALTLASWKGNSDIVKHLLTKDRVNVNKATCQKKMTPLNLACKFGHAEVVTLLLDMPDVDVNKGSVQKDFPLSYAVEGENTEIVKLLLSAPGIKVNQQNRFNCTCLTLSVDLKNMEIFKLFLVIFLLYFYFCILCQRKIHERNIFYRSAIYMTITLTFCWTVLPAVSLDKIPLLKYIFWFVVCVTV